VTQDLALRYDRMLLILEPTCFARGLVRKKVEVVNYPDGRFAVQYNGTSLAFRQFDKIRPPARRDRRQQAVVSRASDGEGAPGGIRRKAPAWPCGAAAAAD
jgi:hypothetical protein